jgi:hypothetical protein
MTKKTINSRNVVFLVNAAIIIVLISFFTIVYAHVFSSQLGSGDDALISVAARNLAEGNGYALSVPYENNPVLDKFSPGITTGPTLIIPAAIIIKIVGNTLWAPGFTTATFCLILLLFIIYFIKKRFNLTFALLFSITLIIFLYNTTAGNHFFHWFLILGEIPATFLNILALIIVAYSPYRRKYVIIACLLFGLAFTTKMLSLLGFLPLLAWFLISLIREKNNRKLLMINYLLGIAIFLTPFILFELWKVISLGLSGYINNWAGFIQLFSHLSGAERISTGSFIDQFIIRNDLLSNSFGFSIYILLVAAIVTGVIIILYSDKKFIKLLFILLMTGSFLHLFYWVFFSLGWVRYALIGLFLFFTALSLLVFIKLPKGIIPVIIILLITTFLRPLSELKKPINRFQQFGFNYCLRLENLQKTVSFLEKYKQDRPFISAWWASAADIEYALPDLQNFKQFNHLTNEDYSRDLIIALNTKFTAPRFHTDNFHQWNKENSKIIYEASPYIIYIRKPEVNTFVNFQTIDFSKSGNSNSYITYGWGRVENSYRWTIGETAGLSFMFPYPVTDSLTLKLLGSGFLAKGKIKEQEVSVSVNKHFITKWHVTNQNWYKAIIPPDFIIDSTKIVVDFEIKNAASPAGFGYSIDKRKLGLCVKKIVIN